MSVEEAPPSSPGQPVRARERLAVRIWLGIGALFGVLALAVALCISALVSAYRAIEHTSALAAAERHAVAIGVAAREQYMHDSHGVLLRDVKHLGHERHWAEMLSQHIEHLRPLVNGPERQRLETIQSDSAALSKVFTEEIFPAVLANDDTRMRKAHIAAETRVDAMISASDASVAQLSTRTKDASSVAIAQVRRAVTVAAVATTIAGVVALLLAVGFARQIVTPVRALNAAAARIGHGDFNATLVRLGTWEFDQLGRGLRQMAERLREREARVLQAERLATIGAIAAGVAHELNNPLGVILGYLKRLRRHALPGEVEEELRIVDDEAHQCRRIVEDLVTYAREPRLDKVDTDVGALVHDVCERMRSIPEMEGHEVTVVVEGSAKAAVDPTRIAQVTRNLVLNAVMASPRHAGVSVRVSGDQGEVVVAVADQGAGIDEADLPHIFEPFYSRRSGGTGLGLAVSEGIVRTHGGTIEIESVRGTGTSVVVRLPRGGASS